jgi:hypothetical protein
MKWTGSDYATRYSISNPNDSATWQKMAAIKMNILRRMDSEPVGVRVCCIKFVQKVVQTQTPGMIADPRVRFLHSPIRVYGQPANMKMGIATGAK